MSGYLQRLVSAAMRPSAAVHPVVAPLFSMPDHTIGEEERTGQEVTAPHLPGQKSAEDELEANAPSGEASLEIQQTYVPFMPETVRSREDSPQPQASRSALQVISDEAYSRAGTQQAGRIGSAELAANTATYKPLLRAQSSVIPQRESSPRLQPPPSTDVSQRRTERTAKAGRVAAKKHEPDEIQITIGRIEVTAVPEVTRSATKPARKQLSLDEYLKRADARGR